MPLKRRAQCRLSNVVYRSPSLTSSCFSLSTMSQSRARLHSTAIMCIFLWISAQLCSAQLPRHLHLLIFLQLLPYPSPHTHTQSPPPCPPVHSLFVTCVRVIPKMQFIFFVARFMGHRALCVILISSNKNSNNNNLLCNNSNNNKRLLIVRCVFDFLVAFILFQLWLLARARRRRCWVLI